MKKYIIGRVNASATIFVPYDCLNRCNFCSTKHLYKDEIDFEQAFENIKKHIDLLSAYGITIFTLTGGEPLADLNRCKKIVDYLYNASFFKDDLEIYINTSLPKGEGVENIINYLNDSSNHINGISVSRHRNTYEQDLKLLANVFDDEELKLIKKPSVRINCLAIRNLDPIAFVNRFKNHDVSINFRANYMKINSGNLHEKDDFSKKLSEHYKFIEHTQCNVCDTDIFIDEETNQIINYHKGIYTTKIENDNFIEINDFVINMFGDAYIDWIFEDENLLNENIMISINESLNNIDTN